jgi:hypothetical protein
MAAAIQNPVVSGWTAFPFMAPPLIWIGAAVFFPFRVLTADRDGISARDRRRRLSWAQITQVVIFGKHGGRVTVAIRARPNALPTRPWSRVNELLGRLLPEWRLRAPGRDRPFAFVFESACTDRSAHELADQFRAVTSVPVTEPGTENRQPYAVRAPFVSVLPLAAFFLVWNGVIGTAWAIDMIHEYPHALVPLAVAGVGVNLVLIDLLIPGMTLTADGAGLRISGEFLAWNEIEAIDVTLARNDTELTVKTAGSAELIEAEVRRRLAGVRIDPARLAAAAPSHVAVNLVAQS